MKSKSKDNVIVLLNTLTITYYSIVPDLKEQKNLAVWRTWHRERFIIQPHQLVAQHLAPNFPKVFYVRDKTVNQIWKLRVCY